jgi:hypothetical protein
MHWDAQMLFFLARGFRVVGIHPTSTPSGSGSAIAADQAATARRAACQFHGRRSAILFAG